MVSPNHHVMLCASTNKIPGFDSQLYTSGRWLRNDKYQRQMRRIDLDFDKLCQKIVDLTNGTKSVKNCEKMEGGFNRVFIFTMNDNSRVVARLPFTVAGPPRLATASEVATIQFCVCSNKTGEKIELSSLMTMRYSAKKNEHSDS